MKTSALKLFISLFAILTVMSSCLGDSDSSYSSGRDFCYIYKDPETFKQYAVASAGYIAHDKIDLLTEGYCYYIAYKIRTGNGAGVFQAESLEVLNNSYPISRSTLIVGKPYSNLSAETRNDTIVPLSVRIGTWVPTNLIGDNWQFGYTVNLKENEKAKAYFYFDPAAQIKDDGTALDKNQVIIDVRFAYDGGRNDADVPTVQDASGDVVAVLNQLRNRPDLITPEYTSGVEYVDVAIRFRYQKPAGDNNPATLDYLGSWTNTSNSMYYMRFSKNS